MNGMDFTCSGDSSVAFLNQSVNLLLVFLKVEVKFFVYDFKDSEKFRSFVTTKCEYLAHHKKAISAVFGISEVFEFVNAGLVVVINIT
jgi:hypothetical protein